MKRLAVAALLLGLPALAAATPLEPGQWQMVSRIVDIDMPGAPPQMLEMMRKRPMTLSMCLTPEQAARNPRALFEQTNGRCTYSKFVMAAGRLDMEMSCKGVPAGAGSTMKSTGTYTPTSYSAHSIMLTKGPRGPSRIVSDGIGKRVGPCKG